MRKVEAVAIIRIALGVDLREAVRTANAIWYDSAPGWEATAVGAYIRDYIEKRKE